MSIKLFYFVLLGLIHFSWGALNLQINKRTDNIFYPVSHNVEENVGTTFSLICELVSSANETQYDDQLSWVRNDTNSKFLQSKSNDIKEINKSEKIFQPLLSEDRGIYLCVSDKFKLVKGVEVVVRNDVKREPKRMRDMIFCNEHMFQCVSNGLCIIQHYVCDGKPDCKDGSDESLLKCNGDPCKDKIPCDDGRCIPAAWCCDRHHDPNCTVMVRPSCCQGLSDVYEEPELEYHHTVTQSQQTARYLFVLVCFVSIAFSVILLFLIISKVVIFAKKAALQQQANRVCENIALRNQTNINVIPCSLYTYRASRTPRSTNIVRNIIIDSSDVNDPLLFNPTRFNMISSSDFHDQPPSYVDVLRTNRLGAEPPPPYQSQEAINATNISERENP